MKTINSRRGSPNRAYLKYIIISLYCATGVSRLFAAAGTPALNYTCDAPRPLVQAIANPGGGFYGVNSTNIYQIDAEGRLVPGFLSAVSTGGSLAEVYAVNAACRADTGDLFVGGAFYIGGRKTTLAKLHADGSAYTDFEVVLAANSSAPSYAAKYTSIAADGSGGCFIGGAFDSINGTPADGLAHVDAKGKVRVLARLAPKQDFPLLLARAPDGVLVVEGKAAYKVKDTGGITPFPFHANQWNKAHCATFDPRHGLAIAGQTDRGVQCYVYDAEGNLKSGFSQQTMFEFGPSALAWDSRGNLLAASARLDGVSRDAYGIKRLLPNGGVDPTWSRTLVFDAVQTALVDLGDSIIVSGGFTQVNSVSCQGYARLNAASANVGFVANHATRGKIIGGSQQMIMGFVLQGEYCMDVLIRASGPSLRAYGVTQTVSQTRMDVYRGSTHLSTVLPGGALPERPYTESAALSAVASAVGAFPFATKGFDEAQTLLSLPPGLYTVIVDAPEGQSGDVLGEIYYP
jgi:hypothetical protein